MVLYRVGPGTLNQMVIIEKKASFFLIKNQNNLRGVPSIVLKLIKRLES